MRVLALISAVALAACGGTDHHGTGGGAGGGSAQTSLDLNDVSWLFPLPDWNHRDQLLGLDDSGAQGALMPRALYDQLVKLVPDQELADTHDRIKVVSVRVDPCFPATVPPAAPACFRQIRLVAQPIISSAQLASLGSNQLSTDDATIHLFYNLDAATFGSLVDDVYALKKMAGDDTKGALRVHPVLKDKGLDGDYAKALKAMVLKYAGDTTLTRVAEMNVAAFSDTDKRTGFVWSFEMFDRSGSSLTNEQIARVDSSAQGVQQNGSDASRQGSLNPSPPNDDFETLMTTTDTAQADDYTLESAFKSALTFENPDRSSPRAVDCGSCHAASRSRTAAEQQRNVDTSSYAEHFNDSAFDLSRQDQTPTDPHVLRAFGYFFDQSAFSQRTINDSAVTARALSR
jgi:hypothetical protein